MINQGAFDPIRFYDVSFQYFQNHIYYFKRIRQTIQKSPIEIEEKTFLRLYRLNVQTFEESECFLKDNIHYEISEPAGSELNSIFSQEFGKVQERVQVGIRQPKSEKEFLQTLFLTLQKFVKESEANQISIVRVLDMKLLQLVNPDKNAGLEDLKKAPLLASRQIQQVNHIFEFIPIDKFNQQQKSLGGLMGGQSTPKLKKQITFNELTIEVPGTSPEYLIKINFVMINSLNTILCSVNLQKGLEQDGIITTVKNFDTFYKIWNPDVQIQMHTLNIFDEHDNPKKIDQYFFIGARGKIWLVWPNYEQKAEKYKMIEILSEQTGINQTDHEIFKKITLLNPYICDNNFIDLRKMKLGPYDNFYEFEQINQDEEILDGSQEPNVKQIEQFKLFNSVQDINHLKMILNLKDISAAHIFTFCEDEDDAILYITQAQSRSIDVLYLKDNHVEECFFARKTKVTQQITTEGVMELLNYSVENLMKCDVKNRQSLKNIKHLSRHSTSFNFLQEFLSRSDHFQNPMISLKDQPKQKFPIGRSVTQLSEFCEDDKLRPAVCYSLREQKVSEFEKSFALAKLGPQNKNMISIPNEGVAGGIDVLVLHNLPKQIVDSFIVIFWQRFKDIYLLVLAITCDIDNELKTSYIFLKRSLQEIIDSSRSLDKPLIKSDDFVDLLINYKEIKTQVKQKNFIFSTIFNNFNSNENLVRYLIRQNLRFLIYFFLILIYNFLIEQDLAKYKTFQLKMSLKQN